MSPLLRKIFFIAVSLVLLIAFLLVVMRNFNYFSDNKITQDRYFSDYRTFMQGVQSRYHTFDRKNWVEHDEQFYNFAYILRKDFDTLLTFRENIELQQMAIMYNLCKYKSVVNKYINTQYRSDANDLAINLNQIMDSVKSVYTSTYTGGAINLISNGVNVHAKPYNTSSALPKQNAATTTNTNFSNEELMQLLYNQLKQNANKKDTQAVIIKNPVPNLNIQSPKSVEELVLSTADTIKKRYVIPFIIDQLQK